MSGRGARPARLAVSPYARRLARERAVPLESLRGSGPFGRIVARDVLAFDPPAGAIVAAPAVELSQAPLSAAQVTVRTAAFATSVALTPARGLLATLASAGTAFEFDIILLRAVGRAFVEIPDAARKGGVAVALELANRQVVIDVIPSMSLTSLRSRWLAALSDGRADQDDAAALSVLLLPASGIRPVEMPLLPGRAMRLTVCMMPAADLAECLVTADVDVIEERVACAWLAAFKSGLENPLQLLV